MSPFRLFGRPGTEADRRRSAVPDVAPAYRPPHSGGSARRRPAADRADRTGPPAVGAHTAPRRATTRPRAVVARRRTALGRRLNGVGRSPTALRRGGELAATRRQHRPTADPAPTAALWLAGAPRPAPPALRRRPAQVEQAGAPHPVTMPRRPARTGARQQLGAPRPHMATPRRQHMATLRQRKGARRPRPAPLPRAGRRPMASVRPSRGAPRVPPRRAVGVRAAIAPQAARRAPGTVGGEAWGGPLTSGDPRVDGDPPTDPRGFPPVPAFSPVAPHPAEAAALAGAFAVDYLSWDEDDPERRGRVLVDYLPTPGRDPARLGWTGKGRQRAEFALPGPGAARRRRPRAGRRPRPRHPVRRGRARTARAPSPTTRRSPGRLAAAPAPTGRGWRSLASTWIRLSVPVTFDGGRMVVDAWDETLGEEPPPATRPGRRHRRPHAGRRRPAAGARHRRHAVTRVPVDVRVPPRRPGAGDADRGSTCHSADRVRVMRIVGRLVTAQAG